MKTHHLPAGPGIYLIRNKLSLQAYVGSSENVRRRVRHHLARLTAQTHGCKQLQAAYDAVPQLFEAVVACECAAEELATLERGMWEHLKHEGLLLGQADKFQPRAKKGSGSAAKAEAMRARWADPVKRAALEAKINARRADPAYRESIREKNRRAVQIRWEKRSKT